MHPQLCKLFNVRFPRPRCSALNLLGRITDILARDISNFQFLSSRLRALDSVDSVDRLTCCVSSLHSNIDLQLANINRVDGQF